MWDCVFDIKSISWHIPVIVLQIFKHRTWQFAAKGGSTSEDDEVNKDSSSFMWSPPFFFWLAKHFSLQGTWLYGNSTRGRMLNTPPSRPPSSPRPLNFTDVSVPPSALQHPHGSERTSDLHVLLSVPCSHVLHASRTRMWQNRTMRVLQRGSALTPTEFIVRGGEGGGGV